MTLVLFKRQLHESLIYKDFSVFVSFLSSLTFAAKVLVPELTWVDVACSGAVFCLFPAKNVAKQRALKNIGK